MADDVLLGDRYRLADVLGQGGMATVYRAHDLLLGRDVAVKLFPPVTEGAEEVLRHEAEMRVLARLSHPGLVTLHDAGTAPAGGRLRRTYLVMELVPGPTLAERLTQGALPAAHVAHVGRQVAEALVVVHGAGVVHRDIKPANVLLTEASAGVDPGDGAGSVAAWPTVKLADFGIARLADGARLTVTGTTLGTASYLSPEQATGSALGPPSDLYSLGLVLLECLTGAPAFTGTMLEVAAARLTTAPPVPEALGPGWVELLRAMTARGPGDRPTAAEVSVRLAALGAGPEGPGGVPARIPVPGAVGVPDALPGAGPANAGLAHAGASDGLSTGTTTRGGTGQDGVTRTGGTPAVSAAVVGTPVVGTPVVSTPVVGTPVVGGTTASAPDDTEPVGPLPAEPVGATRRFTTAEVRAAAAPAPQARPAAARASSPAGPVARPEASPPRSAPPRSAPRTPRNAAPGALPAVVRRHRRASAALAVVVALGVGGAALAATRSDDAPPPVPPAYPVVDGGLGEALQDLQRSVQP